MVEPEEIPKLSTSPNASPVNIIDTVSINLKIIGNRQQNENKKRKDR